MNRRNSKRMNLLGLRVRVRSSHNPSLEAVSGRVVDETKNMLVIAKRERKIIKIPKSICTLEVDVEGKTRVVDGTTLIGRLERRLTRK
ncbi:MAG: ribonuclease P protein subunit [Nitrososphaeria archaeon]|nr:ribonuclease P protein subunit [Nitrososphaeria archaeon]